ncbi:MAG: dTMP kinase [Candidatus Dadabacteria bacterium]|nr:dTMP kinase [Candidatus Dadabacteria bacterium]
MLVTFEGIDGCGKSTQAALFRDHLSAKGAETALTHEPGDGGDIGRAIRKTILLERMKNIDPLAELFLFCADRVHHVETVIRPALEQGKTVISDRFFDSTVAYQGYGRGIDIDFAAAAARRSALGVEPAITFFLDAPVEVCLRRLENRRGEGADRMDREAGEFYDRIREGFIAEAEKQPRRIKVIDARGEERETHGKVVAAFERADV